MTTGRPQSTTAVKKRARRTASAIVLDDGPHVRDGNAVGGVTRTRLRDGNTARKRAPMVQRSAADDGPVLLENPRRPTDSRGPVYNGQTPVVCEDGIPFGRISVSAGYNDIRLRVFFFSHDFVVEIKRARLGTGRCSDRVSAVWEFARGDVRAVKTSNAQSRRSFAKTTFFRPTRRNAPREHVLRTNSI